MDNHELLSFFARLARDGLYFHFEESELLAEDVLQFYEEIG